MLPSTTSARGGQPLTETDPRVGGRSRGEVAEAIATGGAVVVCVAARLPHHVLDAVGIRAWGLALVVVVALVSAARAVARAPFTLRRSLGGSTSRASALRRWAGSETKIIVASLAVGSIVSLPLYALLRATPNWWLLAGIMFAAVTVAWQAAMPLVLRAQAGPLLPAEEGLSQRLHVLATRAGVDARGGVAVAGKTGDGRCNAYVVGLGPTRRIVLEQAVASWPPELVDQAVAHELGHWRLGHGARRLPVNILSQLVTLAGAAAVLTYEPLLDWAGITGAGDPRSYPLLLVLGAALAIPARCLLAWRVRAQERAADEFALKLLDRPDDLAAMLRRSGDESGAPAHLPWWKRLTASHPPIDERVAACRAGLATTS